MSLRLKFTKKIEGEKNQGTVYFDNFETYIWMIFISSLRIKPFIIQKCVTFVSFIV